MPDGDVIIYCAASILVGRDLYCERDKGHDGLHWAEVRPKGAAALEWVDEVSHGQAAGRAEHTQSDPTASARVTTDGRAASG